MLDKVCLACIAVIVTTASAGTLRRVPDMGSTSGVETVGAAAAAAASLSAPANDNFGHRAPLPTPGAAASTTRGSLLLATAEAGEPSPALYPLQSTIWYEWTAAITGVARVGLLYASSNISEVGLARMPCWLRTIIKLADTASAGLCLRRALHRHCHCRQHACYRST